VAAALVVGPLLASLVARVPVASPPPGVWLGAALSLLLGLIDDRAPMRPTGKLLGQIAAAGCLVLWGTEAGFVARQPWLALASLLGVVALLNAINFLDAMDGIVSALVPVTGLAFVALSLRHGADVDLALAWGAVGAAAGFLVYNAPPAKIFLGDAGSHVLGFVLAALALRVLDGAPSWPHIAALLAIFSYPVFDVVFVVLVRISERRPIHVGGVDPPPWCDLWTVGHARRDHRAHVARRGRRIVDLGARKCECGRRRSRRFGAWIRCFWHVAGTRASHPGVRHLTILFYRCTFP
jgi:UDP-N-acetylmuramyl pentapeptide phosphotransferase/UDP-N-acetylglucosamine-1-phosphate transferase